MHISMKLAIVGFILFIAGMVWKLAMGIPLGFWASPPEDLVTAWQVVTAVHWAGFLIFIVSLVYYFWKGRKSG